MQDWSVEIRERQAGVHVGDLYIVYTDKDGRPQYTLTPECNYIVKNTVTLSMPSGDLFDLYYSMSFDHSG